MKKITRKLLVITGFAFTGCKKNPWADFSRSTTPEQPIVFTTPKAAGAPSFSMNNTRPRVSASTIGAVLASNFANWNSGWLSFISQTRID